MAGVPTEITVKTKRSKIIDDTNFYTTLRVADEDEDETAAMVDVPIKISNVDCLFDAMSVCAVSTSSTSTSSADASAVHASKNSQNQDSCYVRTKKRKNQRTLKRRVRKRLKRTNARINKHRKRSRTQNILRTTSSNDTKNSTISTNSDDDVSFISSSEDENSIPGELKFRRATDDFYHVDHQDSQYHEVSYLIPVPKNKTPKDSSLTPITVGVIGTIGCIASKKLLRVLLDPGSSKTLVNTKIIPKDANPKELSRKVNVRTIAGNMTASEIVRLKDIRLPEFDKNRQVNEIKALTFDSKCRYDAILGADFLTKAGINIMYETGTMEWFENVVPMRNTYEISDKDYLSLTDAIEIQHEENYFGSDWMDCYLASPLLDAKYEKINTDDVAEQQTQLTSIQRKQLADLLAKHRKLFDGTLGVYPHKKFHIDIEKDAKPVHARAYSVPKIHLEVFKKELQHLVKLGVLSVQGASSWASPTFVIPKKDGRVRWISDLRALNKVVKRYQYPLPIITDVLKKRKGYKFFTKLDISMQYYTFELDEESKDLCTIVTPFGKFKYNRLPMGLKCSPDIAQEVMENILRDIEDCDCYIDDVGCFSDEWGHHLKLLDSVLERLKNNGFTINPLKCEWAVKETDWLGYWLTPNGLKPWKKKIEAVLKMEPPQSMKQLRGFIGAVNFYRDMWPHRSHVLAPLTNETGKKKLNWTPKMQTAFDMMKALMATEALTAYPNHNKPFHIYTDASNYQLGAVIVQDKKPVAYFSRKLNKAQLNYTTMEQELLSIVETLKELRSMLLGAELHVHTDHKNLTFENLNTQRVLRWRTYVEEYSPTFHYIEGPKNVIADTFSRLHRNDGTQPLVGKIAAPSRILNGVLKPSSDSTEEEDNFYTDFKKHKSTARLFSTITQRDNPNRNTIETKKEHSFYSLMDEPELMDCLLATTYEESYLNLPFENLEENPLNLSNMRDKQYECKDIQRWKEKYPKSFIKKEIGTVPDLICYVKPGTNPDTSWRIVLPTSMLDSTIKWFHLVTGHPGSKRLELTLRHKYYHQSLRNRIEKFHCPDCQKYKLDGKGYGLLPEREIRSEPFEEVAVDLIGPWKIPIRGKIYEFNALTSICTVTGLVELVRIDNKTSAHISKKFSENWLARYPWPQRCVHDNGGEFTGYEFQRLLEKTQIKDVPTSSKNPQANAICERMHQTVGNVLRTLLHVNPPSTTGQAKELIDEALSTAMHAMRSCIHTTLGGSPGSLVFNRDMFLNIPFIADWNAITQKREQLVNENLRRANRKRRRFDYAPNQRVLKKLHDPTKLGQRTTGPHKIQQVHVNGTLTIELREGVTERINIRRVIPFREDT